MIAHSCKQMWIFIFKAHPRDYPVQGLPPVRRARTDFAGPGGRGIRSLGVLANIEFEVNGAPGSQTNLVVSNVALNDGAIPASTADGSFAVNQVYAVSGTVRFWNGGAGVGGALLSLSGNSVYTGTSSSEGTYAVTGAPAGDYTMVPSKSGDARGLSAYDASLVLQHAAGVATLAGPATSAADVDSNGSITAMDAFYILQKVIDLIPLPFPGSGVVWKFQPSSRSYPGLSGDLAGQDYTAILLGDVSGNWADQGAAGQSPPTPATAQIAAFSSQGSGVMSASLGAAQNWLLATSFKEPGKVRLATAGAVPITQKGQVITLKFQLPNAQTKVEPGTGKSGNKRRAQGHFRGGYNSSD